MKSKTKNIVSYSLIIAGIIYLVYLGLVFLSSSFWKLLIAIGLIIAGEMIR